MRTILLFLLLTILPASVIFADAADLYSGEAAVADQSDAERKRALPVALSQVLRKLSGLRQLEDYAAVKSELNRASSMLVAFHYRNAEAILANGEAGSELRLVAKFSESHVDEMMRTLQLPLWQPQRAALEIWLVVDNGMDRLIMPVEFDYARSSMDEIAAVRGMPVTWPEPDEEGAYAVDTQLLWGGYTEELAEQGTMDVLVLAARREGPEWGIRANLGYRGETQAWRVQDIDLEKALGESLQQVIDHIAVANTIAAADQGNWSQELTVIGLVGSDDYLHCLNYLQGISVVNHVSVISAQTASVRFQLDLGAAPAYLDRALATGGVLEPEESGERYFFIRAGQDD